MSYDAASRELQRRYPRKGRSNGHLSALEHARRRGSLISVS